MPIPTTVRADFTIPEAMIFACAESAHEANRLYCAAIGDLSQTHWEDAEGWQQDSAVQGVFAALGGASPEDMHAAWSAVKLADGWTYGPIKDPGLKQHPCLGEYQDLPESQKAKDYIVIDAIWSMADALGYRGY